MPTIVTHAILPLIGIRAFGRKAVSARLTVAAMTAGMIPDADVVGRMFHVPHTADLGHRGLTHSILFALVVALSGTLLAARLHASRRIATTVLFLATLSHALADMLTNGGKGMMLFWPLDRERFAFAVRPIEVAHVGLQDLWSGRIWSVLLSETVWLLVPATLIALLLRSVMNRRFRPPAVH